MKRRQDEFTISLSSDWVWHDPFADCSLTVQNGVEIRAANDETQRYMRVLHEEVMSRIKTIREG